VNAAPRHVLEARRPRSRTNRRSADFRTVCSVIFPDVEAGDLAISQVEDVTDRFVLEPMRLILQRPALQIRHGLTDLDDDRSIRGPCQSLGARRAGSR
jgi:hypothetical protein